MSEYILIQNNGRHLFHFWKNISPWLGIEDSDDGFDIAAQSRKPKENQPEVRNDLRAHLRPEKSRTS